jgi:hypothetical protein
VVDDPFVAATKLSLAGTVRSAAPAVTGLARAWGPILFASLFVRRLGRLRWAVVGALAVSTTRDWGSRPDGLDPLSYMAVRVADDLAYGTGVWWGCWRARTLRPLLPAIATAARRGRPETRPSQDR